MKIINITNGEYFNSFFKREFMSPCAPFNEAMMSGDAPEPIYNENFIAMRSAVHGVERAEYMKKMAEFSDFITHADEYDKVILWFGADAFCQINMITVLALMESAGFCGKVYSVIIDDGSFEVKRGESKVFLGTWHDVYRAVLQRKQRIHFGDRILDNAVDLYLDFIDEDGALARFVKDNPNMSDYHLNVELLRMSEEYGLSDVQAAELIKKYR